jgi:flagellin
MSMVIGTNVASLTAQRHLETSRASMETSMERLSSGKRINSAMDDSAGLAISHSLESKISSMNQGIRNANDGISMLQTAEGALEETSSMLNRMKELATQASSGSYSASDRVSLNAEFQALASAITSIAQETDFNGTNMLNSEKTVAFQVGDGATDNVSMTFQGMKSTDLAIFDSTSAVVELADNAISQINGIGLKMAGAFTIAVPPTATKSLEMEVNGTVYTQAYDASATTTMNLLAAQITNDQADIIASADTGVTLTLTSLTNDVAWSSSGLKVFNDSEAVVANADFAGTTENAATVKQSGTFTATAAAINQTFKLTVNGTEFSQDYDTSAAITMEKLALQIGNGSSNLVATTSAATNLLLESTVAGTAFTVGGLVTTQNHGGNASILTAAGATGAMSSIDASIAQVDSYRSELGAVANRLDHTVSNLMNRVENQSAAKSRIEDTDFAVESANLAKAQVLQQAGTAMLAQANASGQSVLSLLK